MEASLTSGGNKQYYSSDSIFTIPAEVGTGDGTEKNFTVYIKNLDATADPHKVPVGTTNLNYDYRVTNRYGNAVNSITCTPSTANGAVTLTVTGTSSGKFIFKVQRKLHDSNSFEDVPDYYEVENRRHSP